MLIEREEKKNLIGDSVRDKKLQIPIQIPIGFSVILQNSRTFQFNCVYLAVLTTTIAFFPSKYLPRFTFVPSSNVASNSNKEFLSEVEISLPILGFFDRFSFSGKN